MRDHFRHRFLHLVLFIFSLILPSLKIIAATPLGVKCHDNERHALLDFKSYIVQDPDDILSTWMTDEEATDDCCNWYGVTCNNQTGHVTSLDLRGGELEGKISPSLLNLSYLNYLDLSRNSFNGFIPMFIGSMTRLRYLDLSTNSFNGSVPMFIGSMTRLRYLDLSKNSFNGSVPMFIGSMTWLRYLDLSHNSFNGSVPMFIGSMTRLRYLDLSENSFTGPIPPALGNLTNLEYFFLNSIGNCTIENIDWLSHMSHLHHLGLNGISLGKANHWVDVILRLQKLTYLSFQRCDLSQVMNPYSSSVTSNSSSIVILYLGNNNLNSSMYHWLFPLTSNKLVDLDLSSNKLDGIPKYLGNLCSLESLSFVNNQIAFEFRDFLYNLTGCTSATLQWLDAEYSRFTGSLSDDIQKFSSLDSLYLSNNQLNGTISEKVWQLPKLGNLDVSSNSLKGAISEYIGKSKLFGVDLSNNSLEGVHSETHMLNLSYIESIGLRSCKLGPRFPKWIQKLKNLTHLDISNNGISDTIPVEFWNTWPSRLDYLDLSSNNITGKVTDLLSNFDNEYGLRINLSSNNFHGSVEHVHSSMVWLDLSKNKFHGEISFLCQIVDGVLQFLDLSQNSFTGKIPDCLWNFKALKVLNLGENNLSGRLPTSIEHLFNLEVLYLNNNNFSGDLPSSLKNCTKITFLELKNNNFSGYVPVWIGEKLLELYVLSLTSNNFFGTIPLQLCHLVKLQILDLSTNNLYGTIPSCLNNLTAMVQGGFTSDRNVHHLYYDNDKNGYVDHEMINWQGTVREFRSTLGLVKSIDLSNNNLTGYIPYELTDLHELITLNLSMNDLHGEIPPKIGLLKSLLHLDLSINNLSGRIPTSLSQMTSLDYLNVSCNNLSGRIPSSTQLQSFKPSSYTENEGLCGLPLIKSCPGDKEIEVPPVVGQSEVSSEGKDELDRWFYIGVATGFATGFWIICGTLLGNRRARYVFFHIIRSFKDWVYVKVMVFVVNVHMHRH